MNPLENDPRAALAGAYAEKRADYFECPRPEMFRRFPPAARRVLDVGCGGGVFGQSLKQAFGAEIWGVEPDEKSFALAAPRLDHARHGYFDAALALPPDYFDCIFFNDVLEHLVDPAAALALAKKLLRAGGRIIASIPNIAHFPTVWRLAVRGEWEYAERGILDRTHLRFFTRQSIAALFAAAGFRIAQLEGINEFVAMSPGDRRLWQYYRLVRLLPNPHLHDMRYLQFAVVTAPEAAGAAAVQPASKL